MSRHREPNIQNIPGTLAHRLEVLFERSPLPPTPVFSGRFTHYTSSDPTHRLLDVWEDGGVWYACFLDAQRNRPRDQWVGPYPTAEGAYLAAIGD